MVSCDCSCSIIAQARPEICQKNRHSMSSFCTHFCCSIWYHRLKRTWYPCSCCRTNSNKTQDDRRNGPLVVFCIRCSRQRDNGQAHTRAGHSFREALGMNRSRVRRWLVALGFALLFALPIGGVGQAYASSGSEGVQPDSQPNECREYKHVCQCR
jgi:hypothetical protein